MKNATRIQLSIQSEYLEEMMSLEHVQDFYTRLSQDESFRAQIQAATSKEECSKIVKAAGYDFTLSEFEEYTAQLLESSSDDDEILDLDSQELEAVMGGSVPLILKRDWRYLLAYGLPPGLWDFYNKNYSA